MPLFFLIDFLAFSKFFLLNLKRFINVKLIIQKNTDKKKFMTREELASRATTIAVGASMADIVKVIDQIGNPKPETIDYTCSLIAELSKVLKETAREPYGACAVIYSMVLDPKEKVQKIQLEHLQKYVDPDVFMLTNKLLSEMDGLNIKYRLPIIDIAIPALKQLSLDQYLVFRYNLATLIKINSSVRLQEWLLQKILFKHLDGQFFKLTHTITRYFYARQAKKEIELILSVMAYAGHKNQNEVEAAFAVATTNLECDHLQLVAKNEVSFSELDRSLQELEKLKPSIKQKLLTACAVSVTYDQKISPVEVELLRVFSDVLDCPMPPVIM